MTSTAKSKSRVSAWLPGFITVLAVIVIAGAATFASVGARADNFTDIFYTNSFRGAFSWIAKLNWVGTIVQAVISIFSLLGVALLTIRIMTSLLYLSAKGMWEEVHDLKSQGSQQEKDFLGLMGMAKTWASGSKGTGLDAIIVAVLMLLPDVKSYSDFSDKAGDKFSNDISASQYILKIALPTVMTVFFFAMGFNGTLFQALAITVDALGTVADKVISINYSGIIEDLVNTGTGYKFVYDIDGTELGQLKQSIAVDVYGQVIRQIKDADANQLYDMGQKVQTFVDQIDYSTLRDAAGTSAQMKTNLDGEDQDEFVQYFGYEVVVSGTDMGDKATLSWAMSEFMPETGVGAVNTDRTFYLGVTLKQNKEYNGGFVSRR